MNGSDLRETTVVGTPEELARWEQHAQRCHLDRHSWAIACMLYAAGVSPTPPAALDEGDAPEATGPSAGRLKLRMPAAQLALYAREAERLRMPCATWMRLVLHGCSDDEYASNLHALTLRLRKRA